MKKSLLFFTALSSLLIFSCKNGPKKEESEAVPHEQANIMESDVNTPEIACYQYVSAKDTVTLQMEKINDEVAGTLSYTYFEKDKNDGTFEGKMVGDTLFADYTFNSEGSASVREIMFVNKGNTLVEGYADVEESQGKMKFKDNAEFTLNDAMPLSQIDCEN